MSPPPPLTLGSDLSGVVEEAGPSVSEFKKGDEIYGVTNPQFCGANAQYAVAHANMVALRPSRLSHVEAAAATGATAQPSSAASSMPSTLPCRPISISIWSWTITPPTRRRRSKPGLPNGLAITFTSLPPTPPGSIRSSARWFALLTERQIRRGVHRSIKELEAAVAAFIADHNAAPRPFLWTKSADQIFSSIARYSTQRTLTVHASSLTNLWLRTG